MAGRLTDLAHTYRGCCRDLGLVAYPPALRRIQKAVTVSLYSLPVSLLAWYLIWTQGVNYAGLSALPREVVMTVGLMPIYLLVIGLTTVISLYPTLSTATYSSVMLGIIDSLEGQEPGLTAPASAVAHPEIATPNFGGSGLAPKISAAPLRDNQADA